MKNILLLTLAVSLMSCAKTEQTERIIKATYTGSLKTFHGFKINNMTHAAYDAHIVDAGSTITVSNKPYFDGESVSLTVEVNGVVVFYEECDCKIREDITID